jgi:hypothetical protein
VSNVKHPARQWLWICLGLTLALGIVFFGSGGRFPFGESLRTQVPVQITRAEFTGLIERLSEPEGYFDTDNFISNETSYLHVVPSLRENVRTGGAYIGVGPDQNFTYIVHSQPSIAIIADIRRQNLLQHLLFKVLIEEARDRQDFLCQLFSRNCAPQEGETEFGALLFDVRTAPPDPELFGVNLEHIERVLLTDYDLSLTALDLDRIEYVYRSFFEAGLGMRFSTLGRPSPGYPTLEELIRETDLENRFQNYLSDDTLFSRLQQFQRENRIIPIVGDFVGDHALQAAAEYLREQELDVSVFYTSNVEFYLFDLPEWQDYLANVGAFGFTDDAVFIRSYFPTFGRLHPQNQPGHRPTSLIQNVQGFFDDARDGQQQSYWDVVARNLMPH